MSLPYGDYLLESVWRWDHSNHEFATITIEGVEGERYEPAFEQLVDPSCSAETKEGMLEQLKRVAQAQNKCLMADTPHLVRLYRITAADGVFYQGHWYSEEKDKTPKLNLTLKLICTFDDDNNPISPKNHSSK